MGLFNDVVILVDKIHEMNTDSVAASILLSRPVRSLRISESNKCVEKNLFSGESRLMKSIPLIRE